MKKKHSMHKLVDAIDGKVSYVKIVRLNGVDGFVVRWTESCGGCDEVGEYESRNERGSGCEWCGYTGKNRREEWVPINHNEYEKVEQKLQGELCESSANSAQL